MKYKYDVVRSARKSMAVSVSTANKITVRCPWGLRLEEIEKFLDEKSAWIEKVVLQNSKKLAVNDDIIELRQIYLNGKRMPLVFGDKNAITEDGVFVKSVASIEKLYIKHCAEDFYSRVDGLAAATKLYPNSVSIKDYKGRWGCCDAKNNLIFNYKLFMLPCKVQEYVIIHELCHTLCHNHSAAFWKLVSDYVPDYKQRRNEMRNYDFITALYNNRLT